MDQYLLDELRCINVALKSKKMNSRIYSGNEINVICDEHSLAAYLAAFYLSVREEGDEGTINLIAENGIRNEKIYTQANEEFAQKGQINIYKSIEEYKKAEHTTVFPRFYYFANLQLPEYRNEEFVKSKKESMKKWLEITREADGRFLFIPIFNFNAPFGNSIAACSEREVESVVLHDSEFYQGKILMELEDICRESFQKTNHVAKVIRFDNIFGPMVKHTSKLGFDEIIDELMDKGEINFKKSDSLVYYTGCYIRQAVTAIHVVGLKGKSGHIYNAGNYRFTVHDVKNVLYKSFIDLNPKVNFIDDLPEGFIPAKQYECLGNIKIKNLKWANVTPLQEAFYRTALAKTEGDYVGEFYVTIYQGKLERIKRIEMDIMKEIDRICKENDITYFLVGGSLLGAVRHQGFIPWDDDIDIGMFREDYDKFRKVCPGVLAQHLKYQSYREEPTSHYIFDKIRLKDTYFNTKFSNRFNDIENGLFVDVLVYDKTSNSAFGQKFHIKMIKVFRRLINVRWVNKARKGIHYRASKMFLPVMRRVPYKFYHYCFERALQMFDGKKDSKYIIDGVGQNLEKGAFPLEWFDEFVELPYEDMMFKAPKEYDAYLRKWYGDRYMELLPLSSRNSGHKLSRLDLGKYLYADTEDAHAHENHLLGELYETPLSAELKEE